MKQLQHKTMRIFSVGICLWAIASMAVTGCAPDNSQTKVKMNPEQNMRERVMRSFATSINGPYDETSPANIDLGNRLEGASAEYQIHVNSDQTTSFYINVRFLVKGEAPIVFTGILPKNGGHLKNLTDVSSSVVISPNGSGSVSATQADGTPPTPVVASSASAATSSTQPAATAAAGSPSKYLVEASCTGRGTACDNMRTRLFEIADPSAPKPVFKAQVAVIFSSKAALAQFAAVHARRLQRDAESATGTPQVSQPDDMTDDSLATTDADSNTPATANQAGAANYASPGYVALYVRWAWAASGIKTSFEQALRSRLGSTTATATANPATAPTNTVANTATNTATNSTGNANSSNPIRASGPTVAGSETDSGAAANAASAPAAGASGDVGGTSSNAPIGR